MPCEHTCIGHISFHAASKLPLAEALLASDEGVEKVYSRLALLLTPTKPVPLKSPTVLPHITTYMHEADTEATDGWGQIGHKLAKARR